MTTTQIETSTTVRDIGPRSLSRGATDMTDDDLRALLGDFYDSTSSEQRATISRAAAAIDARWPDPDLADTRREALSAALLVVLGDDTLEAVAARWHQARAVERDAQAALVGALLVSDGSEVGLAERASVNRLTVRRALGKS